MADPIDDPKDDAAPPDPKPPAKPKVDDFDPSTATAEEMLAERARMQKALKEANKEAQSGREAKRRLQQIEEEEESRRREKMSVEEQYKLQIAAEKQKAREAQERADRAESERNRMAIDRDVEAEAVRQGCFNPKQVSLMVRGDERSGIEIDPETGRPTGVKDAVSKLIREYPDLVVGGVHRGGGTPPRGAYAGPVPRAQGSLKNDQDRQVEVANADAWDLSNRVGGYAF